MDEKLIKDAQYRKGLSIAFFNATNSAIALVAAEIAVTQKPPDLETITKLRDFFLEEHKQYYATVIAKAGSNYQIADTLKKLKGAKDTESLKSIWLSLSEDERRDGQAIACVKQLKLKHETIQRN